MIEKSNSARASKRTCCFACVRGRSYCERKGEKNRKKVNCAGIVAFSMVELYLLQLSYHTVISLEYNPSYAHISRLLSLAIFFGVLNSAYMRGYTVYQVNSKNV